jgi:hypothetical protein
LEVKRSIGIDSDLIKVLAHPARWHALDILNQRVASPSEIAREVGIEVGLMAYHVRELQKKGFAELVHTVPRRGATEHYYKATRRALFSDAEWGRIPENVRTTIVGNQFEKTAGLVGDALQAGTFEARKNRHHSLCEPVVDEQGWNDTMAVLGEALERVMEIEAESAERRLGTDEPGIPTAVSIIGFEKAEGD